MPEDQLPECAATVEPRTDDGADLAWLGESEGSPSGAETALACMLPADD